MGERTGKRARYEALPMPTAPLMRVGAFKARRASGVWTRVHALRDRLSGPEAA